MRKLLIYSLCLTVAVGLCSSSRGFNTYGKETGCLAPALKTKTAEEPEKARNMAELWPLSHLILSQI